MKKIMIILTALLIVTLTTNGQNLFFIGENSYPCTETITLKSNAERASDLNVLFAKDGKTGLIAVSTEANRNEQFSENLIIYLEDGVVITCRERGTYEYVDSFARAVYYLTRDQLNKIKISNIHTIRYTIELRNEERLLYENNWSASNRGISTKTITNNFYD